jgi:hypothetical protein
LLVILSEAFFSGVEGPAFALAFPPRRIAPETDRPSPKHAQKLLLAPAKEKAGASLPSNWNYLKNLLDLRTSDIYYATTTVVQYTEDLMDKKPTIQELERLLNTEEDTPIQILPNGEIRAVGQASTSDLAGKKPLTMRENLGGEY